LQKGIKAKAGLK
jgi:hypothetical protein